MPQCQFLFSAVLIPEKLKNKYSRNWKKKLFYEVSYRKTPEARRGAAGGPHPAQACQPPRPRPGQVWPTWHTPGSALSPIYSPRTKNPKDNRESSRKVL